MAELTQREQLALHEFSVRYRAALAKQHMTQEESLGIVRDVIREQYEQEQKVAREDEFAPDTSKEPSRNSQESDMDR